MHALVAGAEPFQIDRSGEVGVLLVHGFTGVPAEMRPLAEHLAGRDIGSIGVLLRGHGTHPDDLDACTYRTWLADAEAGLAELRARYRRIFIVGLSMGGTIALHLAARHASDQSIIGVVPICAPLELDDPRLRLLPVLGRVVRWQAWGMPAINDVGAWKTQLGYRRFRPRVLQELLKLMDEVRGLLRRVRQPILIPHARLDKIVPPRNAHLIFDGVGSTDKRILWLDNCYHVVTLDFSADILNAEITNFMLGQVTLRSVPAIASREGRVR